MFTTTFYYALSLMLLTGTLRICTDGKCRAGRTVLCMALAFFIGGGNYTTILVTLILLMLLLLALLVRKKTAWRQILLVMVVLLTAFAINTAAPGNRVRAATIPRSMDAVPAILYSFDRAWVRVSGWFGWPQGIAIALFALLMWDFVGQCGLKFRFPLLKSALAYAIFSAQMTPSLFAMANVGPGRQIDIYYYAYGWLLLCWTFLWVGWLRNSRIGTKIDAALSHLTRHSAGIVAHIVARAGADAAVRASDIGGSTDERCSGKSAHQRRGADVPSAVHRNPPNAASARRDLRNPGCCGLPGVPEPAGAGGRGAVGLLDESGAGKLFRASAGYPH